MKALGVLVSTWTLFALSAEAHTFVWSVWVNGVDQGTGNGIRHPAYNGPPSATDPASGTNSGYANSPVRDLSKIEMRCNVMGEVPSNVTIKVSPGDIVTMEWHHNDRTASDDIIDASHLGPGLVYISPDPPADNSWVKLQEEGENPPGTWYAGGKLNAAEGKQDVQIPNNLAPGYYLLKGELLALHEANVAYIDNMNRGMQEYSTCVQLEVIGNGTVALPVGVSFPGAYDYTDPGVVYNLYSSSVGQSYTIPGPTVWSNALPSPSPPVYGTTVGYTENQRWFTWIGDGFFTATAATSVTVGAGTSTGVFTYSASWSTAYVAPTAAISSISASYAVVEQPQITTPPARPSV